MNLDDKIEFQLAEYMEKFIDYPDVIVMHEKDAESLYRQEVQKLPEIKRCLTIGFYKYKRMNVVRTKDIDRGTFLFTKTA